MEPQAFGDGIMDMDVVVAKRAKASAVLDQIAGRVKSALLEAGIELELFFLVPNSGNAILTFGVSGDPDDDLWDKISEIVVGVLKDTVGLVQPRRYAVRCATTRPIAEAGSTTLAQVEAAGRE